jgi:hypothetical protein
MFLPAIKFLNTDQFTHDKQGKVFIAKISNLELNEFQQIYDDACDEGLVLKSGKSGRLSRWCVTGDETTQDEDHELIAWHLTPAPETIREFPGLKGYKMVIFND